MDPKLTKEQTQRIARLMERYAVGERVRAVETIFYAGTSSVIPEDTVGYVQRVKVAGCDPLVSVAWTGFELVEITSTESLEPMDRPPRGSLEDLLDDVGRGKPPSLAPELEAAAGGDALQLRAVREDLRKLAAAWLACADDLVALGVLRTGHVPPDGVARLGEAMPVVDRAGALLDVLIKALERHG